MNLNDKIPGAPSFTWGELVKSNTATARGIDNSPADQKYWDSLRYLAQKCLQPARDHFGVPLIINSGYRSPELNKAIGGSPTSFHSIACAADVDFGSAKTPSLYDLFCFFHDNTPFTELIAEDLPNGWIHIALQKGRENEKQLKYKLVGGSVKRATFDEIKKIIRPEA